MVCRGYARVLGGKMPVHSFEEGQRTGDEGTINSRELARFTNQGRVREFPMRQTKLVGIHSPDMAVQILVFLLLRELLLMISRHTRLDVKVATPNKGGRVMGPEQSSLERRAHMAT